MKSQMILLTTDFLPSPNGGGIANFLHNICCLLGSDVLVLSPGTEGDETFDKAQNYRIRRLSLDLRSYWQRNILLPIKWINYVKQQIAPQKNITVVGGFASWSILLTLSYLKFRHGIVTKLIVHGGDLLSIKHQSLVRKIIQNRLLKSIDSFVVNSTFTQKLLVEQFEIAPERTTVLHPGVNCTHLCTSTRIIVRDWPNSRKKILTVARLVPHKGIDLVIRAVAQLVGQGLDLGYIIVGIGPERNELELLASSLDMRDRIHFAGFVADEELMAYYTNSDLFILLSHDNYAGQIEGFGIVFIEANAYGLPVIGGRAGGVSDAVIDTVSGLLVNPKDIQDVTQALYRLLVNEELAKEIGENGRQRVLKDFDWRQRHQEVRRTFL